MANALSVCLFNTEVESSESLQAAIRGLNFVQFAGEASAVDGLLRMLEDPLTDLVFFHLDPDPASVVEVIEHVSMRFPDVAMIALSHQTDPPSILAPMRAGCDQFVCEPIEHMDLAAAVGRVATRRLAARSRSRCIGVMGSTGGAGATSIATNLAMEIGHLAKSPCALIDLNLQFGDVATGFDCEPKYTISDIATTEEIDASLLQSVLDELPCGVSLLACPRRVDEWALVRPEAVRRMLQVLATLRENIVIDLPRRLDDCTIATMEHLDTILIVCQQLVPSVRNALRAGEAIARLGVPDERIQYVVNRFEKANQRISAEAMEEHLNKPVFAKVPNDFQLVSRALDFGRPVAAVDSNNPVRIAIRKMAQHLLADPDAPAESPSRKRGFFGRLLSK